MSGNSTVAIRPMELSDAAAVAVLTSQLGYPSSEAEIQHRYGRISSRNDARLLVAQQNGAVVGWIHVQKTCLLESDPRAEIWGLVIEQSVRGEGIGRRLVEAAERWTLDQGLTVVTVRSNSLRVGAKEFYEHLGYTITKNQNTFKKML